MSLAVVGSTVVDIIVTNAARLPIWPEHSEFTPANLLLLPHAPMLTLGGNGANAAYVAACNGAQVNLFTNIGKDPLGTVVGAWMAGVKLLTLRSPRVHHTAINMTMANRRHARATFFYPGEPLKLPHPDKLPASTSHFFVCGWPHPPFPQIARCFQSLKKNGVVTSLDIGPFLAMPWAIQEIRPLLGSLDLLLANEYELKQLTRCTDSSLGLRKLRRSFSGHLVVKRGGRGALWFPKGSDTPQRITAPKVKAVNTVGAGDSFNGALLAALVLKSDFASALAYAVKIAAKVVASDRGVLGAKP